MRLLSLCVTITARVPSTLCDPVQQSFMKKFELNWNCARAGTAVNFTHVARLIVATSNYVTKKGEL